MISFKQFIAEDAGAMVGGDTPATNVAGPAIAGKDNPLFLTSRFAGKKELKVPHKAYDSVLKGKPDDIKEQSIKDAIADALGDEGSCLVTSDLTGGSVMLKHQKLMRQGANNDLALSASTVQVYDARKVIREGTDEQEIVSQIGVDDAASESCDMYYPAFNFAQWQLGMTEDQADTFANVVCMFVDHAGDSKSAVADAVLTRAVNTVVTATAADHAAPTPEMVKAIQAYLASGGVGFGLSYGGQ